MSDDTSASNLDKVIDLRSKCRRFRILVIGKANAGKTTLLKKVCDSIEEPEIFSPKGTKIDLAQLEGSATRGEHDIENQLIFKSNPGFVFHDSRGFESGSTNETEIVKNFIVKRAATNTLADQLHAIWYCFPTDTNRPLLPADKEFFDASAAGKVPVIGIFTKFDGLITKAFAELKDSGEPMRKARQGQDARAQEMLKNSFITPLEGTQFPPSGFVRLDDMRETTTKCDELIEKTTNALTNETLRLLFVSVQQNNIDICIRFAVGRAWGKTEMHRVIGIALSYFPHIWMVCNKPFTSMPC